MKKSIQAALLISLLLFGARPFSYAQPDLSHWQIGFNAGLFIYQGDLSPSHFGSYKTMKPGLAVYASRILSPSFILRTNLALGSLKGDDAKYSSPEWRQQRNFNFTSPVTEVSELLVWNIFKNNGNEAGRRFSPYLFGGAGVSFLKVKRDYSKLNAAYFEDESRLQTGLAVDTATNTPRKILVIPVGIGVEYYLSPKIALTAEANFRHTFTDYLDGFSQAADPGKKDFYYSLTIGMVYKFGTKSVVGCPALKY
jgi:hypothetical protein